MRKLLYLLLAVSLSHNFAFGQWIQQNSGTTGNLNSVYFVNQLTGWVCGVTGPASTDRIAKTTDGGITWVRQNAGTYYVLNSIQFFNDQTGWAAGIHGTIVKTTNGGVNWYLVFGSTNWDWSDIQFIDELTGWVSGVTEYVYKTTDGGLSWQQYYAYIGGIKICFANINTGYLIAWAFNGKIAKTTNGGINWTQSTINSQPFSSIYFLNENTGWIVGDPSKQAITVNGGMTWDTSRITSSLIGPRSVMFLDMSTGYLAGVSGVVFKTSNSGLNWTQQISGVSDNLNDILFVNDITGWAVGANGKIIKTTNGGEPVGINIISNNIPKEFSLFQNYPNPFNPITNIKFSIAKNSSVKIYVYDITGRVISVLVNENIDHGTYEVEWNASGNSSGIYFYKLETEYYSVTKKLVLIK